MRMSVMMMLVVIVILKVIFVFGDDGLVSLKDRVTEIKR